jgi:hypothetical protein
MRIAEGEAEMMRGVWVGFALWVMVSGCQGKQRPFVTAHLLPDAGVSADGRAGSTSSVPSGLDGSEASELAAGGFVIRPSTIDFGGVPVGFAAPARFNVENRSGAPLPALQVALQDSGASFSISQNECTPALQANEHCSIGLSFQPSALASTSATLQVSAGSGAASFEIPLVGQGLEPGSLILEAAANNSARFGNLSVGQSSRQAFRLINPSDSTVIPTSISINNRAFALRPPSGSACVAGVTTLRTGDACDLAIDFSPSERGLTEATLTATSDGAGSVSLNLSGIALLPAAVEVDQTRLDFADVVIDTGAVLEIGVSNVGDEQVQGVTAAIAGGDAADFTVTLNGCERTLLPGAPCSVSVAFNPMGTGQRTSGLDLNAGAAGSVHVDLIGTGVEAGILILSAGDGGSTDFGRILLGATLDQTFQLTNPGELPTGPLTLGVNSDEFAILPAAGNDCVSGSTDLPPGESCDVRVRFAPGQRSQRNATLVVSSGIGSSGLNLVGTGLAPAILGAESLVDFGGIPRAASASRTVNVTNSGDEPLGAISAVLNGPNQGDFTLAQNDCNPGLEFEGTCSVSVTFSPSAQGSRLATLTLTSAPGGTRDVRLEGSGLEPGTLVLSAGPGASAAFVGNLVVGAGQSQTQTFVLSNPGQLASGIINLAPLTSGFQIVASMGTDCISNATNLEGGASCTIQVQFAPTTRGLNSSTLTASSPGGSTSLALSGTGLAPAQLGVQPSQVTFSNPVTVDQSATSNITVRNQGDVGIGVLTGAFSGTNAADFVLDLGTCGTGLGGNATCTLGVRFTPGGSGTRSATLRLQSSPGGALDVAVSGTGQRPGALSLVAEPGNSNFGTLIVGGSRVESFTLRNSGDLSAGRLLSITLGTGFLREGATNGECNPGVTVLDGGAGCTFRVRFQPTTTGSFNVAMNATSQLAGSASLSLTGIAQGLSNGDVCNAASDCSSGRCIDGVCCATSCNGPCMQCRAGTGTCDIAPQDDGACGSISCNFDTECAQALATSLTENRCKALGQCKTSADCGVQAFPAGTACDEASAFRVCNGQGACIDPVVRCGLGSCAVSLETTCCGQVSANTVTNSTCGARASCNILVGVPPGIPISCDDNADCGGGAACCFASTGSGSDVACRSDCNRRLTGGASGTYSLVCRSPVTMTVCPNGAACVASTFLPGWSFCAVP